MCGGVDGPRQATIGVAQAVGRRSPIEAIRSLLKRAHPQGLTAVELTAALRLSSTTVTARLHGLRARGEVNRNGERRNASGRMAAVMTWVPEEERSDTSNTVEEVRAVVDAFGRIGVDPRDRARADAMLAQQQRDEALRRHPSSPEGRARHERAVERAAQVAE